MHAVIGQGKYEFSIFYALNDEELKMIKNVEGFDYTLHASVRQVYEKADRFNCQAGRLPHDLSELMDSNGFLKFFDSVYVDFYAGVVASQFKIMEKSVFRIHTIEPSGIAVGIVVKNNKIISQSNSVGGTEGILLELNPGDYTLEISFKNSMINEEITQFCETILLEIGISPSDAVAGLSQFLKLKDCPDSSKDLIKLFSSIQKSVKLEKLEIFPNIVYTLPLKSLENEDLQLFVAEFEVDFDVFGYFEIFSEFLTSGLSILVEQENGQTQNIEKKTFSSELKKGKYYFYIKTSKNSGISDDFSKNKENLYTVLEKCVAFQLFISFHPITQDIKLCSEVDFEFFPLSLNTLDKLGIKNSPQNKMPKVSYFSNKFYAPDSNKNQSDFTVFYLESESLLRIQVFSSESPMEIRLMQGSQTLSKTNSPTAESTFSYTLSSVLQQHSSYKIEIFYYSTISRCQTYSLLLEIIPTQRILEPVNCPELSPTANLIHERQSSNSDVFGLISKGYSSTINEAVFQYQQSSKKLKISIPLIISSSTAIVTGHLSHKFIESGLLMRIESDEENIKTGNYKASHRYEIDPVSLSKGEYTLIIEESTKPIKYSCGVFTASVLVENSENNDINSLVKKTSTCKFPDQPESLQIAGQMEANKLHLHKKLLLDLIYLKTTLNLKIEKDSVLSLYIVPQSNVKFYIKVNEIEKTAEIHLKLAPDDYIITIKYEFEEYAQISDCAGFEIDLEVTPLSDYKSLAALHTCEDFDELPDTFPEIRENYVIKGPLDHVFIIETEENTEYDLFFSFVSILSGYVKMQLFDSQNSLIFESIGAEN